MSTTAFELVISDCDGALVDRKRITNMVFAAMPGELGVHLTLADMFERFAGHSMARCLEQVAELRGGPVPDDFAAA